MVRRHRPYCWGRKFCCASPWSFVGALCFKICFACPWTVLGLCEVCITLGLSWVLCSVRGVRRGFACPWTVLGLCEVCIILGRSWMLCMCALCARGTHALGLSWASVYVVHRPWPVLGALHFGMLACVVAPFGTVYGIVLCLCNMLVACPWLSWASAWVVTLGISWVFCAVAYGQVRHIDFQSVRVAFP